MDETKKEQRLKEKKGHPFIRWASWLFLAVSILAFIFTYYRAEITYQGKWSPYYFRYYVISLLGVLFWGVVLRLREGARANIITVTISLVVGLYMVEGVLLFLNSGPAKRNLSVIEKFSKAAAKLGIEYDDRNTFEVINELRNEWMLSLFFLLHIIYFNGVIQLFQWVECQIK